MLYEVIVIELGKIQRHIIVFLVIILLVGCGMKKDKYTENIFALNTYITLTAYGGRDTPDILDRAQRRIQEIENLMSTKIDTSEVSLINKHAGIVPVQVSDDTLYVIERALWYSQLTDGVFDITIYPIVQLWDITGENPRIPDEAEIEKLLPLVDYKNVILDRDEGTVFLSKEGMGIDLGGIAKGYAADEIGRILKEGGIEHALINLGGDIVAVGPREDRKPWKIGVRDPRGTEAEYIAVANIEDSSIVSSGDYERYIEAEYEKSGIRYHHIFDPRTGYPADSGLIGTTVITDLSIDADAISTCLFIMGRDSGLEFIERLEETKGILIDKDKNIYTSFELDNNIDITSEEYELTK